jgi:hypothetical protein
MLYEDYTILKIRTAKDIFDSKKDKILLFQKNIINASE